MSLFGAMDTAISGLSSQSSALGNISDNVANSQTIGFKRIDTSFVDYLTTSTARDNESGTTVARPQYQNNIQGTISQTDNPLGLAITGQGFFPVSQALQSASATPSSPVFSTTAFYTRAGDFNLNKAGYLVNSAGNYLNGWAVNQSTGVINRNALEPIQISQNVYNPVATTSVTLSANLPATPTAVASGPNVTSQVTVYDSLGSQHTIELDWTQIPSATPTTPSNAWTVSINSPDDKVSGTGAGNTPLGTADVKFGSTSGNAAPEGTIGSLGNTVSTNASANITASPATYTAGAPAALTFTTDFGSGPQTITLDLGQLGGSAGLTQFAGTQYTLHGLTQNGVPPGSYSSVTTSSNGDISVNYDNGQSRIIARVPVVTFNSPDQLQRQDGQTFSATLASGAPFTQDAATNGAGSLVTESVEKSNVDIASEFTKLIVAQRAYSANTKIVTTTDDMLQQTLDMKR